MNLHKQCVKFTLKPESGDMYENPEWWTVRMVSEKLNVAMSTVRNYIRENKIVAVRVGGGKCVRIHVSQVNSLVEKQMYNAFDTPAYYENRAKIIAEKLRQEELAKLEKEKKKEKPVYLF